MSPGLFLSPLNRVLLRSHTQHLMTRTPWSHTKKRWRVIHGVRTAAAVAVATVFTLSDDLYRVTETGPWAVITVVILLQPTQGATVQKSVNRCLGTIVAAGAAVLTGLCCRGMPDAVAVPFLIACMLVVTFLCTFVTGVASWRNWHYAALLCCFTYDFLALLAFREQVSSSLYRLLMVTSGAAVALFFAILPPQQRASEQIRLMLAENCLKTAAAVRFATETFVNGRTLPSLADIENGEVKSDVLHQAYHDVILSRTPFEEAVSNAWWEWQWRCHRDLSNTNYRKLSRADRHIVYGLVALDHLMRSPDAENGRGLAFETMLKPKLEALGVLMPALLCHVAHFSEHGKGKNDFASACHARALRAAIGELQTTLTEYGQLSEVHPVKGFTRDIAIGQLLIDTAMRVHDLYDAAERAITSTRPNLDVTLSNKQNEDTDQYCASTEVSPV